MNPYNHSLKIIIAVHHFPPKFKGGAEWRAYRTAKWLQNQGHLVKVISVEAIDDPGTDDLRWVDEEFDSLRVHRLFLNLSKAADPARWEYDNPWIEAHLTGYLAEEKPDIFHLISGYLMTIAAIKAAKSQNIPVVATLTDFWFLCHQHTLYRTSGQICVDNTQLDCVRCSVEKKRRFRLPAQKLPTLTRLGWQTAQWLPPLSRQVVQMSDRLTALQAALSEVEVAICPSRFLLETYLKRGFRAKSMHFLRQGLTHLPLWPVKKSSLAKLRLGYIGQVAPHKGVQTLIEAYSKLQSDSNGQANDASQRTQLRLYGDTTQFPDFYQYLRPKVRGDVQFMGAFDHKRLAQVYQEIDVLIVPSIWYENSPNVILEAFAHQTPVIASNLGGMAELVTDQKTGFLFAPNNADDLAQKLRMILDDRGMLSQLQQNIVPPITLEVEMGELLQIYQSVLLEKSPSSSGFLDQEKR
jgi:glycosyltransferase involved in cell wall biosynthesis